MSDTMDDGEFIEFAEVDPSLTGKEHDDDEIPVNEELLDDEIGSE